MMEPVNIRATRETVLVEQDRGSYSIGSLNDIAVLEFISRNAVDAGTTRGRQGDRRLLRACACLRRHFRTRNRNRQYDVERVAIRVGQLGVERQADFGARDHHFGADQLDLGAATRAVDIKLDIIDEEAVGCCNRQRVVGTGEVELHVFPRPVTVVRDV